MNTADNPSRSDSPLAAGAHVALSEETREAASVKDEELTPRVFNVQIAAGRTVRAYTCGPADAPVVVAHHGWSTTTSGVGELANYVYSGAVFCRLVTFDRPGIGGSTPMPGRRVSDVAAVVEAVLDELSVDVAATYGPSGGGPHALATAALLPDRISRVATIAGCGPRFGPGFDYLDGQIPVMRDEMLAAQSGPEASRQFLLRRTAEQADESSTDNDRRVAGVLSPLRDRIRQQLNLTGPESSSVDRFVADGEALASPWGFEPGAIKVPVRLFHGLEDRCVPVSHSEWLREQIPNAGLQVFPHIGHSFNQLMSHVYAWLVLNET